MSKRKKKPDKPLTEKQKRAAAMLYEMDPVKDVAAELGVHRSTIWRWECLPAFRREWNRIDRNWRRRFERHEAKRETAENAYWEKRIAEAKQKLDEESAKIVNKPGKAWDKAWKEYEIAICRGRSWAELLDDVFSDKPRRRKRRRA